MRMWMIVPEAMCQQHLLGEHGEIHKLLGHMRRGRSIDGFIENGLLEPLEIERRHRALADEMTRRGMNHRSPVMTDDVEDALASVYEPDDVPCDVVDSSRSWSELRNRCVDCWELMPPSVRPQND